MGPSKSISIHSSHVRSVAIGGDPAGKIACAHLASVTHQSRGFAELMRAL